MNIYIAGIGGVGLGPLAMLAQDAGYQVTGSDLHKSDIIELLMARDIQANIGQDGSQIKKSHADQPIDWLVYSSALPNNHPEIEFARKHGIKTTKRADLIKQIVRDKNLKLIAVSGTHGKTTTTGMLIWLFEQLGFPVSYLIGTEISFGSPAEYQKTSEYFVYECDEFDRNFLEFKPDISLITTLDYDHPDTYPTRDNYLQSFRQFCNQSNLTVTWQSIADKLKSDGNLFVVSETNDMRAVTLPGHNQKNAWLAMSTMHRLGLIQNTQTDWQMLAERINKFPGTKRRFEKLADNLYTDYAHHPAEITSTIKMAQEINPNVVVVYQPHQNIRQHEIIKEGGYINCFDGVKKIYWLPTYLSREYQKPETLSQADLIKTLDDPNLAEPASMNDDLWQKVQKHCASGDLVLTMSAGDLDTWLRKSTNPKV